MTRVQLRIYTINRGQMDEFVHAWQTGIYPLRYQYNFRIEGAWIVEDENKFVWLLAYDGDDWDSASATYYNSPERKKLIPDPATFIAHIEARFIRSALPAKF